MVGGAFFFEGAEVNMINWDDEDKNLHCQLAELCLPTFASAPTSPAAALLW